MTNKPVRKCLSCGANLNSRNTGRVCWPCLKKRQSQIAEKMVDVPYYTVDDLCYLLGYKSPESIKRLGRIEKIPGRIPNSRQHLYQKDVVDEWIRNSGSRIGEKKEKHYQDLSVTALKLASNLELHLNNIGEIQGDAIGVVIYGGWVYEIVGKRKETDDGLKSFKMQNIDKSKSSNLFHHLKDGFPELAGIDGWSDLSVNKITDDFVQRLKLKATRGDFKGSKCPGCPG
jgi:hypothetical protein